MILTSTGDPHGNFSRFSKRRGFFSEQTNMNKKDYMLIPGDFGGVWDPEGESDYEKQNLDYLENRSFSTLFCDGNHENHARLNSYPVEEWNGGLVHRIRPSIRHLMRGEVYTLEDGYKIFSFGGARSHDISGGVLHKDDPDYYKKLAAAIKSNLPYRTEGIDIWYDLELPCEAEMENGMRNLEKHNFQVDLVLTHDCPSSILKLLYDNNIIPNSLNVYLEEIHTRLDYKLWIFGHHHVDKKVTDKDICLYSQIIRIH